MTGPQWHDKNQLTVLRATHPEARLAKRWDSLNAKPTPAGHGKTFWTKTQDVASLHALYRVLTKLSRDARSCVIRGRYKGASESTRRLLEHFDDVPRSWAMLDVDDFPLDDLPVTSAVKRFIRDCLPPQFHDAGHVIQLSGSFGHPSATGILKAHIWFMLQDAHTSAQLRDWAKAVPRIDPAPFSAVQQHFTASPVFADGLRDPVAQRLLLVDGGPVPSGFCEVPPHHHHHVMKRLEDACGGLQRLNEAYVKLPLKPEVPAGGDFAVWGVVLVAIEATLPYAEGQRAFRIFAFARRLRALFPDAKAGTMRPYVAEWFRCCAHVVRTKEFAETWADFLRAWDRVRCAHGDAIRDIVSNPPALPPGIDELGLGDEFNRLVQVCLALAEHHAPEPFFLSTRVAGELIGLSRTAAGTFLRVMVDEGVLELVAKGTAKTRRASTYRFIWPNQDTGELLVATEFTYD